MLLYHPEIIGVSSAATGNTGSTASPPCLAGSSEKCDLLQQQSFRSNPFCNPSLQETSGSGGWEAGSTRTSGIARESTRVPAGWTLQGWGRSSCRGTPAPGFSTGTRRKKEGCKIWLGTSCFSPSSPDVAKEPAQPSRATFHEKSQDAIKPRTNCPQMAR